MYKVTLRIIPVGSKEWVLVPLKTLDSSPEVVKSTPFSDLINDVRPLISEAIKDIKPNDLKLFYVDATGNMDNTFTFWIDKTTFDYMG